MEKIALITGASRGIGAATARLAVKHGWAVAVNYLANEAAAQGVVDAIRADGGTAIAVQGDVASEVDILAMFQAVDTQLGRISALLATVQSTTTPLLRQMARFSHWLALVIVGFVVLTFAIGVLWRGQPLAEMFMMAVALAASAIPEGLPALMTITLALGVRRMAQHKAIIRQLSAVETLGSVTVICSDKTGTLTCNEMTVQRVVTANQVYEVSGSGYRPEGGLHRSGHSATHNVALDDHPALPGIARAALLCNDAALHESDGSWVLTGDPTEGALLTLALKAGLDAPAEHARLPRTDAIPFESAHRFMATLHHEHTGQALVFVKGAPERVLTMCHRQLAASGQEVPLDAVHWNAVVQAQARQGRRVRVFKCGPDFLDPHWHQLASGAPEAAPLAVVRDQLIDLGQAGEQLLQGRMHEQRDVGLRISLAQGPQAGRGQQRIAERRAGNGQNAANRRRAEFLRRARPAVERALQAQPAVEQRFAQAQAHQGPFLPDFRPR